jgi:hypothetical protein
MSAATTLIEDDPGDVDDSEAIERPVLEFAAIDGRWRFDRDEAVFEGPGDPRSRWPLGLARAAGRFRDGVIHTKITLDRLEKTTGGVFFGYESERSSFFAAQIGAYDRAYAISEYRPDVGWKSITDAGLLSNLSKDKAYDVRVRVIGHSIRLSVNGVDVLNTVLPNPIEGTGFGLDAWGDAPVRFSSTRTQSSRRMLRIRRPSWLKSALRIPMCSTNSAMPTLFASQPFFWSVVRRVRKCHSMLAVTGQFSMMIASVGRKPSNALLSST